MKTYEDVKKIEEIHIQKHIGILAFGKTSFKILDFSLKKFELNLNPRLQKK